jgi:hypothetical protein
MGGLIGLGRRHAPDLRDNKYRLAPPVPKVSRKSWFAPPVLDQGNTSECVGHAARSLLSAGPVINKAGPDQHALYRGAQANDEWPGTDYEGTSVRGAMKFLQGLGFVTEYRWAQTIDDIVNHCLTTGPVDMGTNWYREMFTPDRWGYIEPKGANDGGHSWLVGLSIDVEHKNPDGTKGRARMQNSWGRGWGQNGRAWITLKNLEQLLHEDGEAAVAVEVRV